MRMASRIGRVNCALLVGLCAVPSANATDGYFSNAYGTQCKGLAGACTALALDSLATANNPAAMLEVSCAGAV